MLLLFGCGDGTRAPAAVPELGMLDPHETHYGRTYADWAVAHMKWQFESPFSALQDVKGCTNWQSPASDVVFLEQFMAAKTQPKPCVLSSEKAIFFPLLPLSSEAVYYTDSTMPPPSTDPEVLEDRVKTYMDDTLIEDASISVDGRALRDPTSGEVSPTPYSYESWPGDSLLFNLSALEDADIPPQVAAVVAGYWILLPPLAPGEHELSLSIRVDLNGKVVRNEFTYDLSVE